MIKKIVKELNMDKYAAQNKYLKNNARRISFTFMKSTESDIIEQIDKQSNKAGYIKRLIREDIEREQAKKE